MVPATPSSTNTTITVSAPGKLLLAGGYLVLESPNPGVVIGVDKRFYCTVHCQRRTPSTGTPTSSISTSTFPILVKSPQFQQEWSFTWDRTNHSLSKAKEEQSDNPFCEKALRLSMLCLLDNGKSSEANADICSLTVTIQGDNDFYSLVPHLKERNLPPNLEGALQLPPFLPVARDDKSNQILKTGLGSSACLVTSVVAAMVHVLYNSPAESNDDDSTTNSNTTTTEEDDNTSLRQIIFRLSQIAHCHAQGKVGSGFDVASACFGSHIYQRFPKETIADLLVKLEDTQSTTGTSNDVSTLQDVKQELCTIVFDTQWEGGLKAPLHLPPFLQVMLADVSGGSESPSMARKVLAWKKEALANNSWNQEVPHWDELAKLNPQVGLLWQALNDCSQPTEDEITDLATSGATEWMEKRTKVGQILHNLHSVLQETRVHLKAMGEAAQVPIEPDEQSALANATLQLPGVVAALVPGAGGYDALACVYINHDTVRHNISQLWSSWEGQDGQTSVCPLTVQAISFGEGVRVESTTTLD